MGVMDREKVITHLMIIHTWAEFARKRDLQFFTAKHLEDIAQWSDDALNLLKKQEAQKFFVDEKGKITPLPVVFPNCPLKEHEAVVHCGDCKYYEEMGHFCKYDGRYKKNSWHQYGYSCNDDWFCADGVKRDE